MDQDSTLPLSSLLDTLVAAWMHTVAPAGCTLDIKPAELPMISLKPQPVSCTHLAIHIDNLREGRGLAARKLGELLRLIYAASARPLVVQEYDWLQQLLWPNVCTLPHCKCCRDGDRRVQLKIQRNNHSSDSDLGIVYSALFEWNEEAASIEYKQLLAAIQQTSASNGSIPPLELIVTVRPPLAHGTEVHLAPFKRLLESLQANCLADSPGYEPWFRVLALSTTVAADVRVEFMYLLGCSHNYHSR